MNKDDNNQMVQIRVIMMIMILSNYYHCLHHFALFAPLSKINKAMPSDRGILHSFDPLSTNIGILMAQLFIL